VIRARTLLLVVVGLLGIGCSGSSGVEASHPVTTSSSPPAEVSASPSEEPILRTLPGSDAPVCDVSSVLVDVGVDGPAPDRAWAYSTGRPSGCAHLRASVRIQGDAGTVLSSSGSVRCHPRCRIVATPDVDGDGIPEIAVGQRGFATFFSLFRLTSSADLAPLEYQGGHRVPEFAVGGSTQSMWGLECGPGDRLVSWGAGETQEGNGPYDVRIRRYRIRPHGLVRIQVTHRTVAQGDASRLPEGGGVAFGTSRGICGAHLVARG